MLAALYARPATAAEQRHLNEVASSTTDGREMRKALAIQWSLTKMHSKLIAERLNVSRSSVRLWIRSFNDQGISSIAYGKSTGRPRTADQGFDAAARDALAKSPQDYDYDATVWSAELLRKHLYTVTHTIVSNRTIYGVIHRLGYVFKRPKLDLKHKQNPEEIARAKQAKVRAKKESTLLQTA